MMSTWTHLAAVTECPDGAMQTYRIEGKSIVLARVRDDFYAFGNLCTHDEGYLADGWLDGHEVECPLHGARFDIRTGVVTCPPAGTPVPTYPVKIEAGGVYVQLRA